MRQSESSPVRAIGCRHGKHIRRATSRGKNARTRVGGGIDLTFFRFLRRSPIFLLLLATAVARPASAQDPKAGGGEFDCLIQPKMVLKLGTPVPGLLSEVLVDRGAIVKKGDVIARLESGVEEAAVSLAKARADNDATVRSNRAKLAFQLRREERTKLLRKNDNIALSAADEAETAARVAESEAQEAEVNLQLAQLELARTTEILKQRTIRSPIDGVVVARTL